VDIFDLPPQNETSASCEQIKGSTKENDEDEALSVPGIEIQLPAL
jgi:hypothetical protein